jgi:hypothetical protein
VRVRACDSALAIFLNSSYVTISQGRRALEVDWGNDGGLTLWIDGTQQADITGIDNNTRRVDRARLGPLSSVDAGTSGTAYFDAFEARRSRKAGLCPLTNTYLSHVYYPLYGTRRACQELYNLSVSGEHALVERHCAVSGSDDSRRAKSRITEYSLDDGMGSVC